MSYQLVNRGIQWAIDSIDGTIPAGKFQRLACERFERDMQRAEAGWDYYFDADEAERWLQFLSRLKHVKGRWTGQPFDPSGWQCFVVMNLYGWRRCEDLVDDETGEVVPAGTRRFLEAFVLVPRKNGKSFLVAGLGLGHLTIDGESGAEVYCGATTEKQAWEVFRPARQMMLRDPELASELGVEINAKSLWRLDDGSRFEPIIGNPGDGPSPSCSITDEYHEHKNRNQVESMETGMGARQQPLAIKISTAGSDFGGPCYDEYRDAASLLEQATPDDPTRFTIIFQADQPDKDGKGGVPWDSDDAMRQANPNLGISVSRVYLDQRRSKARASPLKQSEYKTKHLDVWVGARAAWMNMLRLQVCAKKRLRFDAYIEQHAGATAFGGFDLATKVDLACFGILIPDDKYGLVALCKHYAPWEAVYGESARNPYYKGWADAGYITVTPGDVTDFGFIEADVERIAGILDFEDFGYDPHHATQFAQRMDDAGHTMIEVRPTPLNLTEPMNEVEARVLKRAFAYNDPVLTWMFGNVVAKSGGNLGDLMLPTKERPEQKIDGVVAVLNAMNRLLAYESNELPEDYELTTV